MTEETREFLYCDCNDPFHLVVFDYEPEDESLVIYQQMNHYLPWWKRLYVAYLYVIGSTVKKVHYTEVYLPLGTRSAWVRKIRDMLNKLVD